MGSPKSFFYKLTMRESRRLYKDIGVTLFIFLILFGAARDYVFVPLMGKIWGLALSTTPDGFISNSNFVAALTKSPWIILVGAVMVIVYAAIAMWQASAIIIGIGYARKGIRTGIRDIFKVSFLQLKNRIRKDNWMILIYSLIIVPLANVYQTNDLISRFIIPEYIQDFINANTVLSVLFAILAVFIIYIALKWFFLLPSFILKKKDFKEAKKESNTLTEKCHIKNGINMIAYSVWELVRLSIVPVALILVPVFICYCFTRKMEFATSLFNTLGVTLGLEIAQNITGTLVQISTMCFLVELYFNKLAEHGMEETINLPVVENRQKKQISIVKLQAIASLVFSVIIAACYLITVNMAQKDRNIILDIFGRTEVVAHKGYSSKAPENTMPAFDLAYDCDSVTAIELDVWSSKDGIPVVIHNENIKEATGIDKAIYECTYEELQKIPAPYHMEEKEFPTARIPSLEEVIAKYAATKPLLIEIKGFKQDPTLPAKIVDLMKKYGCEYTSEIHSGDYRALEAVKKIDPDICCGLILALVTGNYYDLPYADFFSIEHTFISQNTVSLLHRRGKRIYAWTVNYPESADNLRFSGVDGLITDVPEEINAYVSDTNDLIEDVIVKNILGVDDYDKAIQNFESGDY